MSWKIKLIRVIVMLFLTIGSYCDIKTRKLPMGFLLLFAGVGIYLNLMWKYQNMETLVLGVSFGVMFFVIGKVTEEAIGYGDSWMILNLGLVFGLWKTLLLLEIAFCVCFVFSFVGLLTKRLKRKTRVAFFPFLMIGCMGVWNW